MYHGLYALTDEIMFWIEKSKTMWSTSETHMSMATRDASICAVNGRVIIRFKWWAIILDFKFSALEYMS